jgi:hypothetical protein
VLAQTKADIGEYYDKLHFNPWRWALISILFILASKLEFEYEKKT